MIAIVRQLFRQLRVSGAGRDAVVQRVLARQIIRQFVGADGVEIALAQLARTHRGLQRVQHGRLALVQSLLAFAGFVEANFDLVGVRGAGVLNRNNFAIALALLRQSLVNTVNRRRAGEANINQRAALEINSVIETSLVNPGGPADDQ